MKGSVRRSQLITTYGVGSIVALEDESVMVAGLDDWITSDQVLEPRLHMAGNQLRLPPGGDGADFFSNREKHIPAVRFPRWYYCSNPDCRRLDTWGRLAADKKSLCKFCGSKVIPSRFIAACEKGHIEDFPYWSWVHQSKKGDSKPGDHELYLRFEGGSGSLASITVECRTCDLTETLEGGLQKQGLLGVKSCGGERPWLRRDAGTESCEKPLRGAQRGASNIWFPIVRSALSIPPWSDGLQQFVQRHWKSLSMDASRNTLEDLAKHLVNQDGVDYSPDEVLAAVDDRNGEERAEKTDEQIRSEEYRAICQGREGDSESEFVADTLDPPDELAPFIDLVSRVSRLREVRALTGFFRLQPSDNPPCPMAINDDWVPAIPIHGEGVFLRFARHALDDWDELQLVRTRLKRLQGRWAESFFNPTRRALTSRFLLAHAFAHALIDQWSLEGGYPAASLRERIYTTDEGTGILIYTAAADSAGSLGGVVAQAEPARLKITVPEAIKRYGWCSSDPVCSETVAQGVEGLNLAACHSCALLPETSCEHRNTLLDRAMLVGLPEERGFGFFASFLDP
jgi:hypothetical protein